MTNERGDFMQNALKKLSQLAKETYLKLLKINITRDSFTVIKTNIAKEKDKIRKCTKISEYFGQLAELDIVHRDDKNNFLKNTSLAYLSDFFKKYHDKRSFWTMYRVSVNQEYRWCVMEIFAAEDYSDEDQNLYLLFKNVDYEQIRSSSVISIFQSLCDNYEGIFYLNLENEQLIAYRNTKEMENIFDSLGNDHLYRTFMHRYINHIVYEADRENVRQVTELSFVTEHLKEDDAYSYDYRTVISDEVHWYRIKFAKCTMEPKEDNLAIGFIDVTREKQMETDFYRNGKYILIVEDNMLNREILAEMLKDDYPVLCAGNGKEALEILEDRHEDIALIITDIQMPVMDGYELLRHVRSNQKYRTIPVIAATGMAEEHNEEMCLRNGAQDYIVKPYNPAIIKNRVDFMIKYREASNMINMLKRDPLTGLYNKEFFFRKGDQIINENPEEEYAVIVSDIENFKSYNDRFGIQAGDSILKTLSEQVQKFITGGIAFGRIGGDIFAALVKGSAYNEWSYEGIRKTIHPFLHDGILPEGVEVKYGIYIADRTIPVSIMCDRAKIALSTVKEVFDRSIGYFDESLLQQMNKEQILLKYAEKSLEEKSFQVYYQPKHDLKSNTTGGAEALVKWIHPELGLVNPGEFIPLFEKNGFIKRLDRYVLCQVCEDILRWKEQGIPVVPVSVNFSRTDFEIENLGEKMMAYMDKKGIDHSLIHIEITETSYSENPKRMEEEIAILHKNGFYIELDDFGTGYSSLNAIGNLDIDVLKLDRSIIVEDDPTSRKNILNFMMQFAKMSNLKTVQEGVETIEQLQRVQDLGCDYVQGFYYSKPLSRKDFEAYLLQHPPIVQ